ncbi:hypothetical protein [Streptomyces albicerus]|jgi:hypothetical protein|uniref:hypothetical protein n=1 Tax=Streptomyces albicerus TaxID=2569859 RepID=UPI001788DC37|nr:hypothetical protein [Streptomyces albicerus]
MTAIVPTRRTRKILAVPRLAVLRLRLRRRPRHAPEVPFDQSPGGPDVWLAGIRLGG